MGCGFVLLLFIAGEFTSINCHLSLFLHFRGDAPIIGHLLEYCSAAEYEIGYSPEGHCHGFNELQKFPPRPQKMTWELPDLVSNELLYTYIRIFDMF